MMQKGITLIELMITILIIGLLAVAASPFTSGWVKDARVAEGAAMLEEAVGRAKAAAMRNTARVTGDSPASMLCLSATKTKVNLIVPATAGQVLTCNATPAWSADLSSVVTIKVDDLDWGCSCFNNKGLPTKPATCNTCSDKLKFQFFHTGVEREIHNFY